MKKIFVRALSFVFAAIIVCSLMSVCAFAAYDDAETVTLSGRGAVYAPADTVTINVSIETTAKKESAAKAENDEILAKLKSLGYGDVSEESYFSYEDMVTGKTSVSRFLLYTTDDVASVGDITKKMIDIGVTGINCICYSVKDRKPYENEALKAAIEDAEKKAEFLGLSMKLSEINEFFCHPYCDMGMCGGNDGMVMIECEVSVIYKK